MAEGKKVVSMAHIFYILRLIVTRTRNINMCSGGREFITITADGDVYPCHMFIGVDEFKMGNVHDEDFPGEKFSKIREMFYKINVNTSYYCNSCWARFICGGECNWQSYLFYKDLSRPTEQRCLKMKLLIEALLPEIADIFQDKIKMKNLFNSLSPRTKTTSQDICNL